MRALAAQYEDKNVLVVGGNGSDCRHVAEHYGFKHIVTPEEVHAVYPSLCPSSANEARSVPLAEVTNKKNERRHNFQTTGERNGRTEIPPTLSVLMIVLGCVLSGIRETDEGQSIDIQKETLYSLGDGTIDK